MRKLIFASVVLFFSLTSSLTLAQVGFQGGTVGQQGGGFSGPGLSQVTVEAARQLRDDAFVILRGNIIRHLGKDKYIFRDSTGDITVDIDQDKWLGQTVTPETSVEIKGEIDKDWNSVEVEVDQILIVK
ncbi:MAG: YgiW/YdeI family stress tolerance OB fold protein [Deltaproteobacteria bacterium]|jgi:uncharacterized protein (TIGR00156 family)|nr:YgiW/YdeI family stress tolerance OB fold protein [Deltaproteobacteria bacterium]